MLSHKSQLVNYIFYDVQITTPPPHRRHHRAAVHHPIIHQFTANSRSLGFNAAAAASVVVNAGGDLNVIRSMHVFISVHV